jgi:hypothetical protein
VTPIAAARGPRPTLTPIASRPMTSARAAFSQVGTQPTERPVKKPLSTLAWAMTPGARVLVGIGVMSANAVAV